MSHLQSHTLAILNPAIMSLFTLTLRQAQDERNKSSLPLGGILPRKEREGQPHLHPSPPLAIGESF